MKSSSEAPSESCLAACFDPLPRFAGRLKLVMEHIAGAVERASRST